MTTANAVFFNIGWYFVRGSLKHHLPPLALQPTSLDHQKLVNIPRASPIFNINELRILKNKNYLRD